MSISLTGGNFATAPIASPYDGAARATWLSWFQIVDVTQANRGLFSLSDSVDGFNPRQLEHGIAPVGGGAGGQLRASCCTTLPNNVIWTKNAQLVPGLHCFMSVFDGTQPAGAANRWRQYFEGIDDGANGVYSGVAPGAALAFVGAAWSMNVGSWFTNGFGARGNYIGCCCTHAGWSGTAATAAQALEIFNLLASGNLAASTLGLPTNWYRLLGNLLDSGGTPTNLAQAGAPAIPFGCPGGDPTCGGGAVAVPLDTDFGLSIRRRR